jgi:ATP-binding cassette subfamily B protein
MNVVERETARATPGTGEMPEVAPAPTSGRSPKLRPLIALLPYVARYRMRAIAAFVALVVAAVATLVVPIAVRRMVDFGFSQEGV